MASVTTLIPYEGDEPYIFISYAHLDSHRVLAILNQLVAEGYRIWFDEGILPGTEWDDNIAAHVRGCAVFMAFLSEYYIQSDNCRDELNFVRDLNKERVLVYLDDIELPDGMKMRLSRQQAIYWNRYTHDFEAGIRKMKSIEGIGDCQSSSGEDGGSDDKSQGTQENAFNWKKVLPVTILALVCAIGLGIGFGRTVGGDRNSNLANTLQETAEESASAESEYISQSVAAARRLKVTLTAPENMSIGGFIWAKEAIAERMKRMADGSDYTMEVEGDQIFLDFPGSMLHGDDVKTMLRFYISRPTELYLSPTGMNEDLVSLSREDMEIVELLDSVPQEALDLGFPAEKMCLHMRVTSSVAESVTVPCGEKTRILQDFEMGYIGWLKAYYNDDATEWYCELEKDETPQNQTILYNWTHPVLEGGFSFQIDDDVNLWADWEDPREARYAGENQVAFGEMYSDAPAIAFETNQEMSAGELLDNENWWKKRLDALDQPYAFGTYGENNVVIKTAGEHLSESIVNMLKGDTGVLLYLNDIRVNISLEDMTWEPLDGDLRQIRLQIDKYGLAEVTSVLNYLKERGDESIVLIMEHSSEPLFRGEVEQAVSEDSLVLTKTSYGEEVPITEADRWFFNLLYMQVEDHPHLPSYSVAQGLDPEEAKEIYGIQYVSREDIRDAILQNLEEHFPDVEFLRQPGSATIQAYLNLPVDENMPSTALNLVHEIYDSIELSQEGITRLACYMIEEDESVLERARVYFTYKNGSYNSYSDEIEESSITRYGIFRGGRLIPYRESFRKTAEDDPFYREMIAESEWTWD